MQRPSRLRDLLRAEMEQRSAAVAEASQLGLDHREIEGRVGLYAPPGQGGDGGGQEGGAKLRKLAAAELRQAVDGHAFWTETRLLDHKVPGRGICSLGQGSTAGCVMAFQYVMWGLCELYAGKPPEDGLSEC